MDGLAFISYSREDKDRILKLVDFLARYDIPTWWDDELYGGEKFSNAIQNVIDRALCVMVAWSVTSIEKDWVLAEAEEGRKRHVLIPMLLDKDIRIPMPFGVYHHFDLTGENFLAGKESKRLLKVLNNIIKYGKPVSAYIEKLTDGWAVNRALNATNQVREMVKQLGNLTQVLVLHAKPVDDVNRALKEVQKTYDVVNKSILKFLAPLQKNVLPVKPFLEIERGSLERLIKTGHGHCTLIETHYRKYGGLRDTVSPLLKTEELTALDEIFLRLGTADGDLFLEMTSIGFVLTNESRAIANLLLSDQHELAKQRLKEDRMTLQPLEKNMNEAFAELQKISQGLGSVV